MSREEVVADEPKRTWGQSLTANVCIRATAQWLEEVRQAASAEGLSLTAFIRMCVARELARRKEPR